MYLQHKGYLGSVEFCEESNMFFGKIIGIPSLIMYDGENLEKLVADFQAAADDYLICCEDEGREPNKPFYDVTLMKIKEGVI
jgi:predicted HicB family RNase H-like nuclease